jgi:mono/diheme cytochrome c family protein
MVTAGVKSSRAQEPSGQDLVKLLACQGCHSMAGRGNNLGPNLDKVGQRLIPENIKKLLASPHGAMPNFAHLRPEELDAVATYLSGSNRIMVGEWTVINEQ